jgi:predicted RNA methylase
VADFGCGYGTFAIPAAQMISGKVYALDIEPEMVRAVEQKAMELNLKMLLQSFVILFLRVQVLMIQALILFFSSIFYMVKILSLC